MNVLSRDRKVQVLNALVEGVSIRSIERMTGVHRDTICRLLLRTGESCQSLLDETIRGVHARDVQVDEIWTYVGKKDKRLNGDQSPELGSQFVFVAMDRDTKLAISHLVGKRSPENAYQFIHDLQDRVDGERMQLTSDGFGPYWPAVEEAFGVNVDYAMLVKTYRASSHSKREGYAPSNVVDIRSVVITGVPEKRRISTSHIERQNLTMRMQMRRFTRLTNAFSKKLTNLKAAVSLHFAWYNYVRIHSAIRMTPAMQSGITNRLWTMEDLVEMAA